MQQDPIVPQQLPPEWTDEQEPSTTIQGHGGPRKRESWKSTLSTVLILVIAPVIALLLTAFVFQSYEVDGPSMERTLQDRDRLIVSKLPRTVARITGNDYIPDRGDIVIFVKHGIEIYDPSQDRQLIKRVIGLPGERVVVRGNDVTIYNKERPKGFNPDKEGDYSIVGASAEASIDITVPEGEIFVAGDNRPNSLDSRTFGTVPSEDIVGVLAYRIFPIGKVEHF